jgi:molybdate transport system substrate-binding protein
MRAMAQSSGTAPIGCTQITEIKYADGVTLVGPLPKEFELVTVYSVAVCADARQPEVAQRFARLLSGPETVNLRAEAGFEV